MENELSQYIFLNVASQDPKEVKLNSQCTQLKVKISDKLESVIEIVTDGDGGSLIVDGKAFIELEDTIEKANLHENQQLLVLLGGISGTAKKWKRFRRIVDSYWYLSTSSVDAVKFVPLHDVKFMGFGIYQNYRGKNMTLKVAWFVEDDDLSDWFDVEVVVDDCVDKAFDFFLTSVG